MCRDLLPGQDRHRRADQGDAGGRASAARGAGRPRLAARTTIGASTAAAARRACARRAPLRAPARRGARCSRSLTGWRAIAARPDLVPRPACRDAPAAAATAPPLRAPAPASGRRRVVYFPSCLTRMIGPLPGEAGRRTRGAMRDVLQRGGLRGRRTRRASAALCCGMPFASKAFPEAAAARAARARGGAVGGLATRGAIPWSRTPRPARARCSELARRALRRRARCRILDFPSFWAREGLPRWAAASPAAGARGAAPDLHAGQERAACPTCSRSRARCADEVRRARRPRSAAASPATAASWCRS